MEMKQMVKMMTMMLLMMVIMTWVNHRVLLKPGTWMMFCVFLIFFNFYLSQVLGEDEFVKCLHSVGVRLTSLKNSLIYNLKKRPEVGSILDNLKKMPEIGSNLNNP